MKKDFKKIVAVLCMMVCFIGACTGCTTPGAATADTENVERESTSEVQENSEIIEKEVEIEAGSDGRIEYSIEGAANDDNSQSENVKQQEVNEE